MAQLLEGPTENILGLSGRETTYGTSRFAFEGNAFFSMERRVNVKAGQDPQPPTFLFPFSTGWMQAEDDKAVFMAKYPSFLASAQSFAAVYGNAARGIQNPVDFLTALQKAGFNSNPSFLSPATINNTRVRMQCP